MKDTDSSKLTTEQKAALAQVEIALESQPKAATNHKATLIKYLTLALFFTITMAAIYLMFMMQANL